MATAQLKQSSVSAKDGMAARCSPVLVVLAFAAIYLIWGSTYLAIRYAIETLPPFLMAATRFLVAGALLYSWAIFKGETIRQSLSQWPRAFIVGALLLLCGNGGVTWAEKYIPSGLTALLIATEPLWVVVLNWGITHKRPNTKILVGVVIGLVGVALLVSRALSAGSTNSFMSVVGGAVIIASSFAWASGSVFANRRPIKASTAMASGMQMLAGGLLLLLMGLAVGDYRRLNIGQASTTSLVAFGYLVIFGSLVAFTAYSWLLSNVTPARAATYAYVNPVVAVVLGWLIAGEAISGWMLIGAAIIIGSVMLITTYGHEDKKPAVTEDDPHTTGCPSHPCA
jgi:drug/metabolite transporter (DMT)-like permease